MMRIVLFLAGLLMLKRAPLRFLARWSVRLGILTGLAYAAKRLLVPDKLPGTSQRAPVTTSGWTAPPPQTENQPATDVPVASESGFAEVVIEDLPDEGHLREAVEESIAEAKAAASEAQSSPVSGEETVTEKPADQEPSIFPRWIKGDGSLDCPDDFPVKAKANSLIYHTIDSSHYEVTIPDVCFASAEDAEAAGYRAPLR